MATYISVLQAGLLCTEPGTPYTEQHLALEGSSSGEITATSSSAFLRDFQTLSGEPRTSMDEI